MLKRGYFSFKLFLLYLLAFIKSFVHVVTSTLAFVFIDLSNAIESMQKCAKDFFPLTLSIDAWKQYLLCIIMTSPM